MRTIAFARWWSSAVLNNQLFPNLRWWFVLLPLPYLQLTLLPPFLDSLNLLVFLKLPPQHLPPLLESSINFPNLVTDQNASWLMSSPMNKPSRIVRLKVSGPRVTTLVKRIAAMDKSATPVASRVEASVAAAKQERLSTGKDANPHDPNAMPTLPTAGPDLVPVGTEQLTAEVFGTAANTRTQKDSDTPTTMEDNKDSPVVEDESGDEKATLPKTQDADTAMPDSTDARLPDNQDFCSDKTIDQLNEETKRYTERLRLLEEMKTTDLWGPDDEKLLQVYKQKLVDATKLVGDYWHNTNQVAQTALPLPSSPSASSTRNMGKQIADKTKIPSKRKAESHDQSNIPSAKRPRNAPIKGLLRTKDFVSDLNFRQISGRGTKGKLNNAALKVLPKLNKLPSSIQDHLDNIAAAALRIPQADKTAIKAQIRMLGGMTSAFNGRIQPWESSKSGAEKALEDYKWQIEGFEHPLHNHQVVAAGFQLIAERQKTGGTQSGFLFDYMGYGKTVEMLAVIAYNPAPAKKPKHGGGTTLVIVPTCARIQWAREIARHCPRLKVEQWDSKGKLSTVDAFRADVLIITYPLLRSAFKNPKDEKNREHVLFRTAIFHRIVLDEGHEIKNSGAQTYQACMKLRGKHRWVVTGTPTPNGVSGKASPVLLEHIYH